MEPTFALMFLEGLMSFLMPCVLPLIPAYLGTVSGASMSDLQDGSQSLRVFWRALLFVLGFSVVFMALGASATLIGGFLLRHMRTLRIISGILIILLGIISMELFSLPFLQRERRFTVKATGNAGAFLLGMAFSFGYSPCIGPILSAVLIMLASSGAPVGRGMLLLLAYSLGLGLPFLLVALFSVPLLPKLKALNNHALLIKRTGGALLVVLGILVLSGSLSLLAQL